MQPYEFDRDAVIQDLKSEASYAASEIKCKRKGVAVLMYRMDDLYNVNMEQYAPYYNGPYERNLDYCTGERGNCGCFHAEQVAIIGLFKKRLMHPGRLPSRWMMACNYSPCTSCANVIVLSSMVKQIVYVHVTQHDRRGIEILRRAGIKLIQLEGKVLPEVV